MIDIVKIFRDNFQSKDDLECYYIYFAQIENPQELIDLGWDVTKLTKKPINSNYSIFKDYKRIYEFLDNLELVQYSSIRDKSGEEIALLYFNNVSLILNITTEKLITIDITEYNFITSKIEVLEGSDIRLKYETVGGITNFYSMSLNAFNKLSFKRIKGEF